MQSRTRTTFIINVQPALIGISDLFLVNQICYIMLGTHRIKRFSIIKRRRFRIRCSNSMHSLNEIKPEIQAPIGLIISY
jgi:hypothetical protein